MINKRVLIVGGGTGGHISPGIALYEECVQKKIDAYLLVGNNDKKFKYLNNIDKSKLLFYGAPSFTKNIIKLPYLILKFLFAFLKIKSFIKNMQIFYVVGMGGYISAPALLAAKLLQIPIYLCEQNTVPGRVTLLFSKYAEKIFTTFEDTKNYINKEYSDKVVCLGNPVRKSVLEVEEKNNAKQKFNLQHCDKIILAIGGSQGAVKINELVLGLKEKYSEEFKNIGIIWCTGKYSFETYRSRVYENSDMGSIYISPFVEDVGIAYTASDIAIARSGAGVMMELAAKSVPSILIPYPYAAANHQSKNADAFVENGASIKIENNNAIPEKVGPIVMDILSNSRKLNQMKERTLKCAKIYAAQDIISIVTNKI